MKQSVGISTGTKSRKKKQESSKCWEQGVKKLVFEGNSHVVLINVYFFKHLKGCAWVTTQKKGSM